MRGPRTVPWLNWCYIGCFTINYYSLVSFSQPRGDPFKKRSSCTIKLTILFVELYRKVYKSVCCLAFIDCWISSIKSINWVWQDWLGLKPCFSGFKRFCDVKCNTMKTPMVPCAPVIIWNWSIHCHLCSTCYTTVGIKNCLKSKSVIKIATMKRKVRLISIKEAIRCNHQINTSLSAKIKGTLRRTLISELQYVKRHLSR